jgi:hypothetical protein
LQRNCLLAQFEPRRRNKWALLWSQGHIMLLPVVRYRDSAGESQLLTEIFRTVEPGDLLELSS